MTKWQRDFSQSRLLLSTCARIFDTKQLFIRKCYHILSAKLCNTVKADGCLVRLCGEYPGFDPVVNRWKWNTMSESRRENNSNALGYEHTLVSCHLPFIWQIDLCLFFIEMNLPHDKVWYLAAKLLDFMPEFFLDLSIFKILQFNKDVIICFS